MGHKTVDYTLKKRIKYAVLNKETQEISIFAFQKDIADLFNVSRKTIYRNLPYENDKYIVYNVVSVP
jgi:DNA-binding GntR family transcriptional regulator